MRVGIGQDSHRFDFENKEKVLVLGGVVFEGETPLKGNSDADVVLHAIANAISGVTCVNIIGEISDKMCLEDGDKDSRNYVKEAVKYLKDARIVHISISIECMKPKITPFILQMRKSISKLLELPVSSVGITATSGEGLTDFGRGEGIQVFCCVTII
jgi:2-C-methyl-D-erythritol 2,4-cyclodiphosphate synthase